MTNEDINKSLIGVCLEVTRVDFQELEESKFLSIKEREYSFKIDEKYSMSKDVTPYKDIESIQTCEKTNMVKESTPIKVKISEKNIDAVESNVGSLEDKIPKNNMMKDKELTPLVKSSVASLSKESTLVKSNVASLEVKIPKKNMNKDKELTPLVKRSVDSFPRSLLLLKAMFLLHLRSQLKLKRHLTCIICPTIMCL